MTPIVSVIVPAFNAERYIGEALESVVAQIDDDAEVVVVDDGSEDETAEVARRFDRRVRLLRQPHRGIAATVNTALTEVHGTFVAAVDADDRWLPGKMERQLAVLAADASLDGVFGQVRQFLSPELSPESASRFVVSSAPLSGPSRGTMLIRREALERVGQMETHLSIGEFVSWYARATDAGLRFATVPEVVYERRIHGQNTTLRERDARSDYLRVVKETLDRRRARSG